MAVNRPVAANKASRRAAAPFRLRLVVMAKVPIMGRVKTRLAREVGAVEAVRFYRHTLAAVLARIGRDPRWQTSLSIAPDAGVGRPIWPRGPLRRAQGGGDLGQRMQRIMDWPEPGPLIIVGTDIPEIDASHIADAFAKLRSTGAILGPAPDGGYWLVGLRRSPRILHPFRNVRWSSAATLADTAANLAGHRIGRAATLDDVDNAHELARCRNRFGRRILPKFRLTSNCGAARHNADNRTEMLYNGL
jgi:uncharacterized protein